jgi:carbon storage regulator
MLVIRRRSGEAFLVGQEVEITVLETSASQVTLGVRAPREIPILRKEIVQVQQQNEASAQPFDLERLVSLTRRLRRSGQERT